MQTILAYRCEICGFSSTDQKAVDECEKGRRPSLKAGDKIAIWPLYGGDLPLMRATILQVGRPVERAHYVHYLVDASYGAGDESTRIWIGEECVARVFSSEEAA